MLKRIISILVSVCLVGLSTGCVYVDKTTPTQKQKPALKIFTWNQYAEQGVYNDFEKLTGIHVITSVYSSNDQIVSNITKKSFDYDLVIISDYMVDELNKKGLLEEINNSKMPNTKNVDARFKGLWFDPENKVSVPMAWGTLGILYNRELLKGDIISWGAIWNNRVTPGKITVLESPRASVSSVLKLLGRSINTDKEADLNDAQEVIKRQKSSLLYTNGDIGKKMLNGEILISMSWSNDAMKYVSSYPKQLEYVVPSEGSNWFVDNMVILKDSPNKESAEKFIDYMCDPEVAIKSSREIYSYPTISEAIKNVSSDNEMYKGLVYPEKGELKNSEMFKHLSDGTDAIYYNMWKNR